MSSATKQQVEHEAQRNRLFSLLRLPTVAIGMHYYGAATGWNTPAATNTSMDSRSGYESDTPSAGGYQVALRAAQIANEVLRKELLAVERAWAEEHASLLQQLSRKDEIIWNLAQQASIDPAALGAAAPLPPKPPRIGHRERPECINGFDLRGSGAIVATPAKGKRARPTHTVSKPPWDGGDYKSQQLPPNQKALQVQPGSTQQVLLQAMVNKAAAKAPTGKKKKEPLPPANLKKALAKPPVPKPPPAPKPLPTAPTMPLPPPALVS